MEELEEVEFYSVEDLTNKDNSYVSEFEQINDKNKKREQLINSLPEKLANIQDEAVQNNVNINDLIDAVAELGDIVASMMALEE